MKKQTLPIDFSRSKVAASVMRALSHPLRLEIIAFIDGKKSVKVHDIYTSLHLDQSIASQHLKIMRDADLVNYERNGKEKHYSVNYDKIKHINQNLHKYMDK
jgi:ArsR family transcriptional regulator